MPNFYLKDLESAIDAYKTNPAQIQSGQLLGIKERLDNIKEVDTTPQLNRVLEKINEILFPPEPIVNDTIEMVGPLLDKLEMKL
jgi:hypothetical protein